MPELFHKYGTDPARLCFVDDRLSNIRDMLGAGVGLGLLAPHVRHTLSSLRTFKFQEIVDRFLVWAESVEKNSTAGGQFFELTARQQILEEWCRTGVNTRRTSRSVFNAVRRIGRRFRNILMPS